MPSPSDLPDDFASPAPGGPRISGDGASGDPPQPSKKQPLVPPHIAWPAFVIALLLLGIGSAFQALFAARSDGGAQIVEDYYDAALRFEDEQAARAASAALGWDADVEIGACENGLCAVEVTVVDRNGEPVAGLNGVLETSRPQEAGTAARIPLSPKAGAPGVYRQRVPLPTAGLWDIAVDARRGDEHFLTSARLDFNR
jgi:nitrogen fixation protein FixH